MNLDKAEDLLVEFEIFFLQLLRLDERIGEKRVLGKAERDK
jgi:hypothetical protein